MRSIIKCRYFTKNGNPINGGCRDRSRCRFLHPDDDSFWDEVPARCKFFDDNGRPIHGGCKYVIPSECAWAHPEEPEWRGKRRPKPTLPRSSSAHVAPPSPPPTKSNITRQGQDQASISVPAQPSPQMVQMKHDENNENPEKKPIRSEREEAQAQSEILQKLEIASDPATPSQRSPIDTHMPSYPKASLNDPSSQMWKDRVTVIATATGKYQELMDTRGDVENDNFLLSLLPDMAAELRKLAENRHSDVSVKQRELEETLNNAGSGLDTFWSIPILSKPSEKYRSEVDSLFQTVGFLLGQIDKIEQSIKQEEEWQREQAGKARAAQESLSHFPSYESLIQRFVELENRLQSLSHRFDDEEDLFASEVRYWDEQSADVKTSYSVVKDQGRLVDDLKSELLALRQESASFTDLNPPLKIQQDESSDINTRLTLLVDGHQANTEKKMTEILQDIDQCCLELTKPDPVTEALQAFQRDILSAIERCLDEHRDQLMVLIQKCHDENNQAFRVQMDPIVNMMNTFFTDLNSFDVL